MSWEPEPDYYNNEVHFVGPHEKLWELQKEVNELGIRSNENSPAWFLHGWEYVASQGWVACLTRTIPVYKKKENV